MLPCLQSYFLSIASSGGAIVQNCYLALLATAKQTQSNYVRGYGEDSTAPKTGPSRTTRFRVEVTNSTADLDQRRRQAVATVLSPTGSFSCKTRSTEESTGAVRVCLCHAKNMPLPSSRGHSSKPLRNFKWYKRLVLRKHRDSERLHHYLSVVTAAATRADTSTPSTDALTHHTDRASDTHTDCRLRVLSGPCR